MMSAHDVAVAALNEVASHQRSESRVGDSAILRSMGDGTATSIEASTSASKNAPSADIRESNASFGFQSSSSNNSQSTVPDATTPPSSDGFSSQSQQSPLQPSQHSQSTATQLSRSSTEPVGVGIRAIPKPRDNRFWKFQSEYRVSSRASSSRPA